MDDSLKRKRIVVKEYNNIEVYFNYYGGRWKKVIDGNIVSYGNNYEYEDFLKEVVFNNCKLEDLEYFKLFWYI